MKRQNNCLYCSKITNNNKFCSRNCSASFNNRGRKYSDTTKLKISTSIKNSDKFKIAVENNIKNGIKRRTVNCVGCGKSFVKRVSIKSIRYCSRKCSAKIFNKNKGR